MHPRRVLDRLDKLAGFEVDHLHQRAVRCEQMTVSVVSRDVVPISLATKLECAGERVCAVRSQTHKSKSSGQANKC